MLTGSTRIVHIYLYIVYLYFILRQVAMSNINKKKEPLFGLNNLYHKRGEAKRTTHCFNSYYRNTYS